MTKADELALFDKCAKKFPADTYVGRFLSHIRPQLESEMRSDVFTHCDLRQMENEAREAQKKLSSLHGEIAQAKEALEKLKREHDWQLKYYNDEVEELRRAASTIHASMKSSLLEKV